MRRPGGRRPREPRRAMSSKISCLAMVWFPYKEAPGVDRGRRRYVLVKEVMSQSSTTAKMSFWLTMTVHVIDLELGAGILRVRDLVALLHIDLLALPVVEDPTRADRRIVPFWGFSLTVSGIKMPLFVISSWGVGTATTRSPSGRSCFVDKRSLEGKPRHAWCCAAGRLSLCITDTS